ncbi:transposase [Candidatus Enterovibrio escicola]|uniref:Mobile element protein n=1 Tax=Candidatus Enterovibrio escicola TaxID=1927127 RepID=A0A2A5T3U2_9GAMM|nr:transposase [Candidatus Enterovibrio escacola]PCS22790.1 Mobile element protein [Candidatus Enterovibrio escacola]
MNGKHVNTVKRSCVSGVNFILPLICLPHEVITAEVSLVSVGDNEVLPILLNPLRRKIQKISADGDYDTRVCHHVLKNKGITSSIPPRSNEGYWEEGHPRNEAIKALKEDKLAEWKKNRDSHKCSLAETAMFRYKELLSPKLTHRWLEIMC